MDITISRKKLVPISINNKNSKTIKIDIKKRKIKILYIYDIKDWAIHNVGKLWLKNIPFVKTTFKVYNEINSKEYKKYDFVWFGFLDLFLENPHDINRSIIAIHDPRELFPQIKNWKSEFSLFYNNGWDSWIKRKNRLRILKQAKNIVITSKEMQNILKSYNIDTYLIQTTSMILSISEKKIKTKKADILSVFQNFPRKNFALMNLLQNYSKKELNLKFDLKIGNHILPQKDYIKLLDNHEIYICTSFQEGGPLPAMDAMKRGSVVLSTPVGQIQEIIKNNENGFICKNENEFIQAIELLSKNLELLQKMRIKSRNTILIERKKEDIEKKVCQFLQRFVN